VLRRVVLFTIGARSCAQESISKQTLFYFPVPQSLFSLLTRGGLPSSKDNGVSRRTRTARSPLTTPGAPGIPIDFRCEVTNRRQMLLVAERSSPGLPTPSARRGAGGDLDFTRRQFPDLVAVEDVEFAHPLLDLPGKAAIHLSIAGGDCPLPRHHRAPSRMTGDASRRARMLSIRLR
jgi:hypothetical protein